MKVLVSGVSGFVGSNLARRLVALGHQVIGTSRTDPAIAGVEFRALDLADDGDGPAAVLSGVEALFHTAAKVDMWGDPEEFHAINVVGTKRLLHAAVKARIGYFIFTSSPSVIAGDGELKGVDESVPYPAQHAAPYPASKAEAERMVLAANSATLKTISLRPHLIFGPGDKNFMPTVVRRAREGKLKKLGDGSNLVDFSYIDDCVAAHVCALDTLLSHPERCEGKAYFISQGDPYPLWDWIERVLRHHHVRLPLPEVPAAVAHGVAALLEIASRIIRYRFLPPITRFLVHEMVTSHYFSIEAAKRDLGYRPTIGVADALLKTLKQL